MCSLCFSVSPDAFSPFGVDNRHIHDAEVFASPDFLLPLHTHTLSLSHTQSQRTLYHVYPQAAAATKILLGSHLSLVARQLDDHQEEEEEEEERKQREGGETRVQREGRTSRWRRDRRRERERIETGEELCGVLHLNGINLRYMVCMLFSLSFSFSFLSLFFSLFFIEQLIYSFFLSEPRVSSVLFCLLLLFASCCFVKWWLV